MSSTPHLEQNYFPLTSAKEALHINRFFTVNTIDTMSTYLVVPGFPSECIIRQGTGVTFDKVQVLAFRREPKSTPLIAQATIALFWLGILRHLNFKDVFSAVAVAPVSLQLLRHFDKWRVQEDNAHKCRYMMLVFLLAAL